MYEERQGSERLIKALYNRKEDTATLQRLAAALNYLPQQLKEDIEALHNFYLEANKEE